MTTKKIYGPWIKWDGGECPVPPDTLLEAALARENLQRAWKRVKANKGAAGVDGLDIVEYCTVTEQADLKAAEKLLRSFGYAVTPPTKPLTFEDVTPLVGEVKA